MRSMTSASRTAGRPPMSWLRRCRSSIRSSSSASRSARVTGAKNGSTPASAASSRSSRVQSSRTVWIASSSYGRSSVSSTARRRPEALAADGVRTRIDSGAACSWATSQAKRRASTVVLPLPAPPSTSSGPPACVTARSWSGVSSSTLLVCRRCHRPPTPRARTGSRPAGGPSRGCARCSPSTRRAGSASSRPAIPVRAATRRSSSTPRPRTPSSPSSTRCTPRARASPRSARSAASSTTAAATCASSSTRSTAR